MATSGLRIIDIANPAAPTLAGIYSIPNGGAARVTVSGRFAYVTDFRGELRVIDVGNPAAPSLAGFYTLPASEGRWLGGVAAAGRNAYVADTVGGLFILRFTGDATFSCSNVTQIPLAECQALVALYNATNGPAWTDSTGWLGMYTPCSWYAVTCQSGHVSRIELIRNNLVGAIPVELAALQGLQYLDLTGNSLSGGIPAALGSLPNLQTLYLCVNNLTGPIPPELGNLSNLLSMDLSGNQLSGGIPPQLGNLSKLQGLFLVGDMLTGVIPPELGNLTNLQKLYLPMNQLTGGIPPQLANLSKLIWLDVSNNALSGPLPHGLMAVSLQQFGFGTNNLCEPGDAPFQAWLAGIPELYRTNVICASPTFTCNAVSQIPASECQALVALYNSTNGAAWTNSDNWLGSNTPCSWIGVRCQSGHVTGLWLPFNNLTGPLPPEIGNLSQLSDMALSENKLSGAIPPQIGNLSKLTVVGLHYNRLTGAIPPDMGRMSSLSSLWLTHNQLSGPIPRELGNLGSLQALSLDENQLVGAVPAEIGNLPVLQDLGLRQNPMSGALPASLSNLHLSKFTFSDTSLCAPGDAAFQAWLATISTLSTSGLTCSVGRVNAGGPAYTDAQGRLWEADQAFAPGGWGYTSTATSVLTTAAPIAGTADPALYQNARVFSGGSATQGYRFAVPPGLYTVTLKFAEVQTSTAPGQRVFDIVVDGITRTTGFDIAGAGGFLAAVDWTRLVPVGDGVLDIALVQKGTKPPLVNAVSVELAGRGYTFDDVPLTHPDWLEIEKVKAAGVTAGCSSPGQPPLFCPDGLVKREEIAVFIDRALGWAPANPGSQRLHRPGQRLLGDAVCRDAAGARGDCGLPGAGAAATLLPALRAVEGRDRHDGARRGRLGAGEPAANIFADAGPGDWFTPHVEAFCAHTPGSRCGWELARQAAVLPQQPGVACRHGRAAGQRVWAVRRRGQGSGHI